MLDALRRGSTGMVAKVLFAVLVFSFAVWGVADVFRGWGRGSLARVGSHEIQVNEFQRTLQNELNLLSSETGRRITTEQARAAKLDQRVLAQMMAWAAIEAHAKELNLALSDEALVETLKHDPSFQGPDGKFSRITFENVVNRLGLSEQGFLALHRRDELREQITKALADSIAVPDAMIDMMHQWREETRTVEFFTIDADKAVTVPEPDEAQIKATYEANKGKFLAPEFREIAVLVLSIDELKKKMDVSDAEIAASYEETKDSYNTPERRRVQQIAFKDKAAAEAGKAALAAGKSFGEVAKDAGAKDSDIDLGVVTKESLIDPKIADAAFKLQRDAVSDVVEGQFATVLVRVTGIEPAVTRTLADVKDEVRDKLARKKAEEDIQKLHDQLEDYRLAGKTLKEIADQMKLTFIEVPAVNRMNQAPDGKQAIALPDAAAILKAAFESQVGLENEAVELTDGSYAWVDVETVTPQKQKPFEEVKADAKQLTIDTERARKINELAVKLVDRANKGEPLAKLAAEAGDAKLETSPPFTRSTQPQGLTKAAVAQIFTLAKDKAGSAESGNNKSRTVFKLTAITPAPALTEEQRKKSVKDLQDEITNDVLGEYVLALQERLGTHINETEFKRATGAETQ